MYGPSDFGAASASGEILDLERAPAVCPRVIRTIAHDLHWSMRATEPAKWFVEVSPNRRVAEVHVMRNGALSYRHGVSLELKATQRAFPGLRERYQAVLDARERSAALRGDDRGRPTPKPRPAAAPEAAPFEELTIEAALERARAANKLLVLVFSPLDAGTREDQAVAEGLKHETVRTIRDNFLFVRRPQTDAEGNVTDEARTYRAAKGRRGLVFLDPWGEGQKILTAGDPYQLQASMQRALLDAARAGHPPKRR